MLQAQRHALTSAQAQRLPSRDTIFSNRRTKNIFFATPEGTHAALAIQPRPPPFETAVRTHYINIDTALAQNMETVLAQNIHKK